MTIFDLLSDTTYRDRAVRELHPLVQNADKFPVADSQIHGLRQIARQQPTRVSEFARHQKKRAEKLEKQTEVDFWDLVMNLCDNSSSDWSIRKEGHAHLPEELREENIPAKCPDMTPEEQGHRKELRKRQRRWLDQWSNEHIPVFFQRFCTQCLYRKSLIEMHQPSKE